MQGEARTRSVGSCKIDCGTLDAMLVGICWISSFVGSLSSVGFLRWIPQPALRRLPSEEKQFEHVRITPVTNMCKNHFGLNGTAF